MTKGIGRRSTTGKLPFAIDQAIIAGWRDPSASAFQRFSHSIGLAEPEFCLQICLNQDHQKEKTRCHRESENASLSLC
jgi:hypothetical protein